MKLNLYPRTDESDYDDEVKPYDTDEGEGFEIVSGNKSIEVITADTLESASHAGPKNLFKPSDLKENFEKIATEKLPSDLGHDAQFEFVLDKILNVVKEAYLGYSSIFFWYNKKK
jgi:hypothetical protein